MLEDVPYIRQVALCLDRDRAGLQAEERIQKNLEGRGYREVFPLFPSGKDWNEDLQELMAKGRRETCRCSREKYGKLSDYSFIVAGIGMMALLGGLMFLSNQYSLNGIKSKTVGDGQYGTARFATEKEIRETYVRVAYEPEKWRRGENLPKAQGLVVGWRRNRRKIDALIDSGGYPLPDDRGCGRRKTGSIFCIPISSMPVHPA